MTWLHKFLSKFHHAEDAVTAESKQILEHVEEEFKALEARVVALEGHTHTVTESPVVGGAPVVSAPAPETPAPTETIPAVETQA